MNSYAGVCILMRRGNVLLASNRRFGGWSLPGGKADGLESHLDAAVRELKEETGLVADIAVMETLGIWRGTVEPEVEVGVYYVRRALNGPAFPNEPGTAIMWADPKVLFEDPTFGSFYREHFLKGFSHLPDTEIWR